MINNDANSRNRESLLGCRVVMLSSGLFALLAQKDPISKITDYGVFRQLTSIDTAIFELTLSKVFEEVTGVSLSGLDDFWKLNNYKPTEVVEAQGAQLSEYYASIAPLVGQPIARETARHFLEGKHGGLDQADCCSIFELRKGKKESHYRLITSSGNVYIIVEEGFLQWLGEPASKLEFYASVLKAMYGLDRINNVNGTTWYSKYLEVLCGLV